MRSKRTKDPNFCRCPICGKMPRVFYVVPNFGWAYCDGTFFHKHEMIMASTGYCNPSELNSILAEEWVRSIIKTKV